MRSLFEVRGVAVALALLAMAIPSSAQQIVLDRGRAAGKYWLFPIAADPHSYLYAVAQAHLARHPDGKPQFSFLRFVENVMSEGSANSLVEATGGGIVHAVIELGIPEERRKEALAEAQRALQQIDPAGKIVGAASYTSGQFMLITSFQEQDESKGKTDKADKWVEKVVAFGEAPILEGGKAAISMRLTKDGAKILWQSFHTRTPDISFVFNMQVDGVNSPVQAKLKVDWERAYSNQKIQVGVAAPMTQIDVDLAFEELRQQGAIKLTEIGDDAEMHNIVKDAYEKVRDLMFDKTNGLIAAKPGSAVAGSGGSGGKTPSERAEALRGSRKTEREGRASHYKAEADAQETKAKDARKAADKAAVKVAELRAKVAAQGEQKAGTVAARDASPGGDTSGSPPTTSPTPTPTPSATPSPKPSGTPTPTPSATPAPKPSGTPTPTPSATPAPKPSGTPTPTPSATPMPSATPTPKPSATSTPSATPTPKPSATPTPATGSGTTNTGAASDARTPEEQLAAAETDAEQLAKVADEEEKKLAELRKKQKEADESVDKVVNDEFALAFSYSLKKERQTLDFEFDFNKYRSANRKLRFDENIGDLHRFLDDDTVFRSVNLDDPMYKQREIAVSVDGSSARDFKDYINYVTVQLRKQHENGDETIQDVRIDRENFSAKANDFRLLYGWKGDNDRAAWFDYQYRVFWSFFGGSNVEGDWIKSTEGTIPISSPYVRRSIEIDGDADDLDSAQVRAVVFTLYYDLGGGERAEKVTLKTAKGELNKKVDFILPANQFKYDYEILWMLKGNKSVSSGRQHGDSPILSISDVPEATGT